MDVQLTAVEQGIEFVRPRAARANWLAFTSVCLALALAVVSLLGPLASGLIQYRYTESFRNQGIGLDAFNLAFAAPLLIAAAFLAVRGHRAAAAVALGPSLMTAYMMPQYVLGAHYQEIAGNNEDFFLLHLGVFILAAVVALLAWSSFNVSRLPEQSDRAARWTGILLLAVAGFLAIRYLPALTGIWGGDPSSEYLDDPIAFWTIAFLDLGVVMPAALAAGLTMLRNVQSARKATLAIIGWFALVGPAVAAMGFAAVINNDPNGSLAGALVFAVYGAVFAALAIALFRPLFRASA